MEASEKLLERIRELVGKGPDEVRSLYRVLMFESVGCYLTGGIVTWGAGNSFGRLSKFSLETVKGSLLRFSTEKVIA